MTSQRSMFTEAIEDHLALKKQNGHLNDTMPLARYDVGEVLDRYPGAPLRVEPSAAAAELAADELVGDVVEGEFRRPLDPPASMTPMLALVEDIDEGDVMNPMSPAMPASTPAGDTVGAPTALFAALPDQGELLRFPGGVGPREELSVDGDTATQATGEHPVIVIDAEEPLAFADELPETATRPTTRSRRPGFFGGLRRKRKSTSDTPGTGGWFGASPKDFDWND